MYKSEQEISLNEFIIPYHGQLHFWIYNQNKTKKYRIQSKMLCKANTRYICNLKIYLKDSLDNSL